MAAAPPTSLDIVTVSIAVATWLVGAEVAAVIGPYAVIVLSALGGAAWSASRREQPPGLGMVGTLRTLLHILLSVGLALIATVPAAELIARWTDVQSRWMLGPAAVVIAARPDVLWRWLRAAVLRGAARDADR